MYARAWWSLITIKNDFFGDVQNKLYPDGWDVHHYFHPDRAVKLFATLTISWYTGTDWYWLPLKALAFMLIFSWFHNGMMHRVRGRQDVPGRGWKSSSETTTAKISFGYWERTFYLVVGVGLYLIFIVKLLSMYQK